MPTSSEVLETVNGILHTRFLSACKAPGLLKNDKHWDNTLEEAAILSSILLKIGIGEYPENEGKITIPPDFASVVSTVGYLVVQIYPDIYNIHNQYTEWLCERAVLTPNNNHASFVIDTLLKFFESAEYQNKSEDFVVHTDDAVHAPVEFLNTLNWPDLPPSHKIIIKVEAPVRLQRNLNLPKLNIGIRLRMKALHKNLVEVILIIGWIGVFNANTTFTVGVPIRVWIASGLFRNDN